MQGTWNDAEIALRILAQQTAAALSGAGEHDMARKIGQVPVAYGTRFACLQREVQAIDMVLRIRWGTRGLLAQATPYATAVELLDLLRAGTTATLAGFEPPLGWLQMLNARAQECLRRHGLAVT